VLGEYGAQFGVEVSCDNKHFVFAVIGSFVYNAVDGSEENVLVDRPVLWGNVDVENVEMEMRGVNVYEHVLIAEVMYVDVFLPECPSCVV